MLILKFHLKTKNNRLYIEEEARVNEYGTYKDSEYVYLKESKVPRHLIDGDIEECYIGESDSLTEGFGPDFQL